MEVRWLPFHLQSLLLTPQLSCINRPYKLMQVMQTEDESSGMRAAIFFLSLVFIVSQFCVNVRPLDLEVVSARLTCFLVRVFLQTAGCAITGSIDLQCLLPKWVNDRRGPFIVAVVAFAIQPWQLINNAATFISVLSSYSIFLGPLTGSESAPPPPTDLMFGQALTLFPLSFQS